MLSMTMGTSLHIQTVVGCKKTLDHVRLALAGGVSPSTKAVQISHDIEGREVLVVYAQVAKRLGWSVFVELPTGEISTRTPMTK